jgi:glycine/D-amino acid oxidase-like deaminating enzyme
MNRRDFLQNSSAFAGLGLLGLTGCTPRKPITPAAKTTAPTLPYYDIAPPLAPIRAHEDRLFRITVCTRPFRAQGPRIEVERVGDKLIVHNYGHGGSGWSLSWGSGALAIDKALTAAGKSNPDVAVIGSGAIGLTTATLLQRAGLKPTIYAKERFPYVRSARATGTWTPDSRVALASKVSPTFPAQWEQMARTSWFMYQSYLGMPGNPIEYIDTYYLPRDEANQQNQSSQQPNETTEPPHLDFARYGDRIADLSPRSIDLPPGAHPFPTKHAYRDTTLMFNIADYARQLTTDYFIAGGKIETAEFHTPADLAALPQPIIFNCTGYAARQLWSDNSLTPVRGQIGWLIPQPEVRYGLYFGGINVISRRDGIVVQTNLQGEASGWNDDNEQPDRAEAEEGVRRLASLMNQMAPTPARQFNRA